jgi:hypothetical protein
VKAALRAIVNIATAQETFHLSKVEQRPRRQLGFPGSRGCEVGAKLCLYFLVHAVPGLLNTLSKRALFD